MRVTDSGLFKIPQKQLRSIGFQPQEVQNWRLTYRGVEIPFWLTNSSAAAELVFYAPPTQSEYSKDAYFVFSPRTSPIQEGDREVYTSLKTLDLKSIIQKLSDGLKGYILVPTVIEEDVLYQPLAGGDPWFWRRLVSPSEQEITFSLKQAVQGKALLRVNLWASTEAALTPDHHYQIYLNKNLAADESWDGTGYHQLEAIIPATFFQKGINRLSIVGILPPKIIVDVVYLDSIELYTWQEPILEKDQALVFGVSDSSAIIDLRHLFNPDWLLDITNPLSPTLANDASSIENPGYVYLAAKSTAIQSVNRIETATFEEKDLPFAHQNAQFLIIGPPDLLSPLHPLVELRRREGLTVETQDINSIYAQYGGYPEPQAIRHYLQDISSLNPRLEYVLLIGDSTYDPKGFENDTTINRLPTFFIQTLYGGQTSTELPFAVLGPNGLNFMNESDHYPIKLAVGRLPAQNSQQVTNYVQKLLAYTNLQRPASPIKVVAVADPQGDMFSAEAKTFLDFWGESTTKELFAPSAGSKKTASAINHYFQNGTTVLGYFGHGSIEMWGKDRLFTSAEAAKLTKSPSIPLVIQLTCLTGYYIHPKIESLSEALLWNPNGGALAIIAPSSLTLPNDQSFLTKSFVANFQNGNHDRIGNIWMHTLSDVALNSQGIRDVLATYTLLGDPTIIVK